MYFEILYCTKNSRKCICHALNFGWSILLLSMLVDGIGAINLLGNGL